MYKLVPEPVTARIPFADMKLLDQFKTNLNMELACYVRRIEFLFLFLINKKKEVKIYYFSVNI